MTEKQVILVNTEALVGADLDLAFRAVKANQVNIEHPHIIYLYCDLRRSINPGSYMITL